MAPSRYSVTVEVQLREGIADPQGATIERALPALGIGGVSGVRAGKSFRFDVDADDQADALSRATVRRRPAAGQPGHRGGVGVRARLATPVERPAG